MTETVITPEKMDEIEALARAWIEHPTFGNRLVLNRAAGVHVVLSLISDNRSRRNMLDMVINSVAAALERAGVKDADDPGEAIDVLVADKDAEIARLREALQGLLADMNLRAKLRGDVDPDGTVVLDAGRGVVEKAHAALNKE